MPFSGLRRELRALRAARPGRRFQDGHDRHRVDNRLLRWSLIALGIVLVLVGALTFWVPGPNFLLVLGGLALVAAQWRFVARQLDEGEVTVRHLNARYWQPYRHKRALLTTVTLAGLGIVVAGVAVAWRQGWLPDWLPFVA